MTGDEIGYLFTCLLATSVSFNPFERRGHKVYVADLGCPQCAFLEEPGRGFQNGKCVSPPGQEPVLRLLVSCSVSWTSCPEC